MNKLNKCAKVLVNQPNLEIFLGYFWDAQGKRNSCGILISYIGTQSFVENNQKTDNDGRILVLDVTINDVVSV